jgi:hypothetical protein
LIYTPPVPTNFLRFTFDWPRKPPALTVEEEAIQTIAPREPPQFSRSQRKSRKLECNLVRCKEANAVFGEHLHGLIEVYRCIVIPSSGGIAKLCAGVAIVAVAFIKPPGVMSASM